MQGSGSTRDDRRRFTLLDVMILVAAAAFGALGGKLYHQDQARITIGASSIPTGFFEPWPFRVVSELAPFLMAATVGLSVLRLIRPRPPWRRLVRQPGTAACLAGLYTLASVALFGLLYAVVSRGLLGYTASYSLGSQFYSFCAMFGANVTLVWLTMAALGCWRPERSWIDRAGRTLGAVAILLWLALHFVI
jgi:hypothetical protein